MNKCLSLLKNLVVDFEDESLEKEGFAYIEPIALADLLNLIFVKIKREKWNAETILGN